MSEEYPTDVTKFHLISGRNPDRENSVWMGQAGTKEEAYQAFLKLLELEDGYIDQDGPIIEVQACSDSPIHLYD